MDYSLNPGDEARSTLQPDIEAHAPLLTNPASNPADEMISAGVSAKRDDLAVHTKPPPRSILVDAVRGMAIALVALGHTNQGLLHRGWWGASSVGTRLDITIYAFHMPAFFFVSGIFLHASVAKRGPVRFTVERLRTLIYPYLLWSVIAALAVRALARFTVQRPLTLEQWTIDLLLGVGIWFFPALFVCHMFGMLLRRLPKAIVVVIALVAFFFRHVRVDFLELGLLFFPFFAAGMWLGRGYERMERIPRWAAFGLSLLLFAALLAEMSHIWSYNEYVLLGGATGTLMLLMLARGLGNSRWARLFAWAGEGSLAIYLTGEYGQGFVRQLLQWAHITAPYPQLILPTIVAIAIPAWAYQYRERLHIAWLFIAPFWKPRPRVPRLESM